MSGAWALALAQYGSVLHVNAGSADGPVRFFPALGCGRAVRAPSKEDSLSPVFTL